MRTSGRLALAAAIGFLLLLGGSVLAQGVNCTTMSFLDLIIPRAMAQTISCFGTAGGGGGGGTACTPLAFNHQLPCNAVLAPLLGA